MGLDITGIGSVFDFGSKVLDKIFPDAGQAAQAKAALLQAQQAGALAEEAATWENLKAQIAVNQVEAGNESLWVSGWRPFVGWCCGAAFAYAFIVQPFLSFAFAAAGHPVTTPAIDLGSMMPVLLGMLGLGAMRSYDKKVAAK